jgi:putative flippase GtrA
MSQSGHSVRLIQFLKYSVGGSLYFVSGYAIFAVAYSGLHRPWWQAKLSGDIIGWTLNYCVQRYWAFTTSELGRHEQRNRLKYIIFSSLNLVLDYVIIGGLRRHGISPYIGMFVAAGFFTGWNYLGYRYIVFRGDTAKRIAGKRIMKDKHD